jgi:hypothetical protein
VGGGLVGFTVGFTVGVPVSENILLINVIVAVLSVFEGPIEFVAVGVGLDL